MCYFNYNIGKLREAIASADSGSFAHKQTANYLNLENRSKNNAYRNLF